MAAHTQEHTSHTKLIWKVFGILSVITIVEVILGIVKPDALHLTKIFRYKSIKHYILSFNHSKSILYYLVFYAYGR